MNKTVKCFIFNGDILTQDIEYKVGDTIVDLDSFTRDLYIIKEIEDKKIFSRDKADTKDIILNMKHFAKWIGLRDKIRYVSEPLPEKDILISHMIRNVNAMDIIKIDSCEEFYLETEEKRKLSDSWDKPINSYVMSSEAWYDVLREVNGKYVVHFEDYSSVIRYTNY